MAVLPTVQDLVERQIQIQDEIESKTLPSNEGALWITNYSKIITGAEIAEQMAKEEPSSEEAAPEASFAPDTPPTEDGIRREMVNIYSKLQLGTISPAKGLESMKILEPIARSFKGSTVEVNVNTYVQEPLPESMVQMLNDVEEWKRSGGKRSDDFLIEELAIAYNVTIEEVKLAARERKSFVKKKGKTR